MFNKYLVFSLIHKGIDMVLKVFGLNISFSILIRLSNAFGMIPLLSEVLCVKKYWAEKIMIEGSKPTCIEST
jgi:hypothetical protein